MGRRLAPDAPAVTENGLYAIYLPGVESIRLSDDFKRRCPMKRLAGLLALLTTTLLVTFVWAEPLPTAKPEQVGMSSR